MNKIYSEYLDEIKYFCTNNNKKLIIFTSPIYNDICKDDNNKFQKIMSERKIVYYDFSDFLKNNNELIFWKDEVHLSSDGANLFTNKISSIVNKF